MEGKRECSSVNESIKLEIAQPTDILCQIMNLLLLNLQTTYSPIGDQLDNPTVTLTTVNVHHSQQLKFHFSLRGNNHVTKGKPPPPH